MHDLLNESMCVHESEFAKLECIDRSCTKCGVEKVDARLERELEDQLDHQITWVKWEHVKMGKSKRMEKVRKHGSVHA